MDPQKRQGRQPPAIKLNDEQSAFVTYQGPAILHAPVGTGKTLALAERAAQAILAGTRPSRILCLTFTNRAADEMRERILQRCGSNANEVVIRTFHGFGAWFLRASAKGPGLPADFLIFDEEDATGLLSSILRSHDGAPRSRWNPVSSWQPKDLYSRLQTHKSSVASGPVRAGHNPDDAWLESLSDELRPIARSYHQALRNAHALDFGDLILHTRWLLATDREVRASWQTAFDLIQVDEMQDTHLSEYHIIQILGERHGNVALAGDFDQTIYEWRGSTPDQVLARFRQDFPAVRTFEFRENYRATRRLIRVSTAVARAYSRRPAPVPAAGAVEGEPVTIHMAEHEDAEATWIAQQVQTLYRTANVPLQRIGVLTRANPRAAVISQALERLQVPHVTVEAFEFFRRQEVKDALAYLRFLVNRHDEQAFRRILLRPARGIGEQTIAAIDAARNTGLRLADLVDPSTTAKGDPFSYLIDTWTRGTVTVFDTETTGVRVGQDEVVELAAIRLVRAKPVARFHRYLRNTVPVGDSARIHGLNDDFLAMHGHDPADVFRAFEAFTQGSLVAGHNVGFDVRMVTSHARRVGVELDLANFGDTYVLAQRLVPGARLSLGSLAERFALKTRPTHRAMDDVEVTCQLLALLIPMAEAERVARQRLIQRVGGPFVPLAADIARWQGWVGRLRPAELLRRVLDESGLWEYYTRADAKTTSSKRLRNLEELLQVFARKDRPELDPFSALEQVLLFAALAKNVDRLDPDDERVRIITVHQAKGLEFDAVFVAGLSEGEFPNYFAVQEGRLREELRIFYVAVTRTRERLFLTGHLGFKGRRRAPSRFLRLVSEDESLRAV